MSLWTAPRASGACLEQSRAAWVTLSDGEPENTKYKELLAETMLILGDVRIAPDNSEFRTVKEVDGQATQPSTASG